ncbi:MAG: enoyl-CoA hydratase [Calditrichaeota bacterium]|nr:MAG: enoyl-CoA hydratase [Calditrichota bacterium]
METVLQKVTNGVLTLTLNRPEKKNALNMEMYSKLTEGFNMARKRDEIRVVYVNSSGSDFTSGNDLADFAAVNRGEKQLQELPVVSFVQTVLGFPKPIVAGVSGLAVGIGTTFLLHCDAVVAGKSSQFHLAFVKLGLVPEFGSSLLFPKLAGMVRGSYYLLSGEPFGAEEAHQMGLVSHLCEDNQVDEIARNISQRIASLPPDAVLATRKLIRSTQYYQELVRVVEEESRLIEKQLHSEEHRKALQAFFGGGKPTP